MTADRRLVRAALRSRMGKRDRLNEGADRGRRAGGGADKRQRGAGDGPMVSAPPPPPNLSYGLSLEHGIGHGHPFFKISIQHGISVIHVGVETK